ncbi:IPT/TIG domain-containing protein [Dactylosporangium roseum]|uniref:IPT/TIG domain-containing protein n=1 Tax=Dactylosporangium roseum TaxID=47989 RepID=A0ABY5ZB21_9ACTN|nr:IPT/TIG domain-containing protein [Dactylosporangium roseum]
MFATTNIRGGPVPRGRTWAGTALALTLTAAGVAVATPAYAAVPTLTDITPSSGPVAGGTAVTITGTNMTGTSGVTFDGVAGTNLTGVTATTVTITTPPGTTGLAPVVVTNADGPSVTTLNFTYVAAPTVTKVEATAGPVAGGTQVTVTGTNLTGATAVTFDGTPGTALTAVTATSLKVTTPAHAAGAAPVVVTTAGGDSNATVEFTYVDPPVVSSVTPSSGPPAGGTVVTVNGTDLADATKVTIGGVEGTNLTPVNATSLKVTAPAGTPGTAPVVVTTAGGDSNSTIMYAYNAAPKVTKPPYAQSRSVGTQAKFTATASGYPTPDVKWQELLKGGTWTDIAGQTTGTLTFTTTDQQNGAQYRAVFQNSLGSVTTSAATLTVVPAPPDAPDKPAAPTLTAGVSSIEATWTAPNENGTEVTGYTVTATPGPATCTTKSKTETSCVLGATAGEDYTVTVVAHSAAGDSPVSDPSNSVTATEPQTPATAPPADAPLTTDAGPISAAEPGQEITLEGSGYAPFSTVVITLYSDPTELVSVLTDANGDFAQPITIPSDLQGSNHSLVAAGVGPDGTVRNLRADLYVASGATVKMTGPIVRNSVGRPQMFARGSDNNLYTNVQAADGTWGTWENLGGLIYSEPVAVLNNNGRLQVFVVGGDHSIWHRLQNADGSFAWWTPVSSPRYLHSLALTQNDDGTVVVMGRGLDDNLWATKQTSTSTPGSWTTWDNLSGLIYSNPTLHKRDDGLLEVFAIGGDGQVWHRVQTAKNTTTFVWWSRAGLSMSNHAST